MLDTQSAQPTTEAEAYSPAPPHAPAPELLALAGVLQAAAAEARRHANRLDALADDLLAGGEGECL